MNVERVRQSVSALWDTSIVPALCDYIRIPNKSVHFDRQWAEHGHMDRAAELLRAWCEAHALPAMKTEILRLPGRTPVLLIEVPASANVSTDSVLLYGHMDKQPEFTGWSEGLAPWSPLLRNGRLYGRGGADDGYAVFASIAALRFRRRRSRGSRSLLLRWREGLFDEGQRAFLPRCGFAGHFYTDLVAAQALAAT